MRSRSYPLTWLVLVATHVLAASVTSLALRIFLTPPDLIHTVPAQPIRYGIYALVALALGCAAGTVLGLFLRGRSWLPVLYLWAVPFALLVYPAIDADGAELLYTAVTSHVAGVLAAATSMLWIIGIVVGL